MTVIVSYLKHFWCDSTDYYLYSGDFNNDGKPDLLVGYVRCLHYGRAAELLHTVTAKPGE